MTDEITDTASSTRPGARASHADPQGLLRWMKEQGSAEIPAKTISDRGPRPFRRRAASDPALAALVGAGQIALISDRPRAYRVLFRAADLDIGAGPAQAPAGEKPASSKWETIAHLPSPEEIRAKYTALLAARQNLPDRAAYYISSVDLREWLTECMGSADRALGGETADDNIMFAFGCDPPHDDHAAIHHHTEE